MGHHSAKFGDHIHCGSGNIMFLIFHVILQDQVTQEPYDLTGYSPSRLVTTLSSLVAMGTVAVEMFFLCHVILQDHVIKESCDFIGRSSSM